MNSSKYYQIDWPLQASVKGHTRNCKHFNCQLPVGACKCPCHILVKPGDLVVIQGSAWYSKLICWATGSPTSHVGGFIGSNPPVVLEALKRVKTDPVWETVLKAKKVWILKHKYLTESDRWQIVEKACTFSADSYGYILILFQLMDALTGKMLGKRFTYFTTVWGRWGNQHFGQHPICSYLWSEVYSSVGMHFLQEPGAATPGDILKYAQQYPSEWEIEER